MALLNKDFRDFIEALNQRKVEYVLVGGYAVIMRGHTRTTGDMDVWVNATAPNFQRLLMAFSDFGIPTTAISQNAFLNGPMDVFAFGRPPSAIEIMTDVKGLSFGETFKTAQWYDDEGLPVRVIHINQLRQAKRAAGRYKDLDDLQHL